MQVKGKVYRLGETVQVTDSLKKRDVVLTIADNPQYPEQVKFETINDRCALLDAVKIGDEVELDFNLKGRAWTNKQGEEVFFNSLQMWKIKVTAKSNTPEYTPPADLSASPDDDDLPF